MKPTLALVAVGVIAVVLAFRIQAVRGLELASYDLRLRLQALMAPQQRSGRLVVLGIDDTALEQYGAWPWPRDRWAEVTDTLTELGVEGVFFDVDFPDPAPGLADTMVDWVTVGDRIASAKKSARDAIQLSGAPSTVTSPALNAIEVLLWRIESGLASPDDRFAASLRWAERRGILTAGTFTLEELRDARVAAAPERLELARAWLARNPDAGVDGLPAELRPESPAALAELRLHGELCRALGRDPNPSLDTASRELRVYAENHMADARDRVMDAAVERSLDAQGETTSTRVADVRSRPELAPLTSSVRPLMLSINRMLGRRRIDRVPFDRVRLPELPWARSIVPPVHAIGSRFGLLGASSAQLDADGALRSQPLLFRTPSGVVAAADLALWLQLETGDARAALAEMQVQYGPALFFPTRRLSVPVSDRGACLVHWSGDLRHAVAAQSIETVLALSRMQHEKERYFITEVRRDMDFATEEYQQTVLYRNLARALAVRDPDRRYSLDELAAELENDRGALRLVSVMLFVTRGPPGGRARDTAERRTAAQWYAFFRAHLKFQEEDPFILPLGRLKKLEKEPDPVVRARKLKSVEASLRPYHELIEKAAVLEKQLTERLSGRFCLIGHTGTASSDVAVTPFGSEDPRIDMHAQLLDTMLRKRFVTRPGALAPSLGGLVEPGTLQLPLAVAFCVLLAVALPRMRAVTGAAFAVVVALAWVAFACGAFFGAGLWLDVVSPLLATGVTYLAVYTWRSRRAEQIRATFQSYVDPRIVSALEADPALAQELGGRECELTVWVSYVNGFGGLARVLPPRQLSEMLAAYLGGMTEALLAHGGTLDKFVGDGIAALFGAPLPLPDHPRAALLAGLDQVALLEQLKAAWAKDGVAWYRALKDAGLDVTLRAAVHTGVAKVGNFGSERFKNYTAIGDAVNLAFRLPDIDKHFGTALVASEPAVRGAGDAVVTRLLERVAIPGLPQALAIHEVVGRRGQLATPMDQVLEIYARALEAYMQRDFTRAQALFERALALKGDDRPSYVYSKRCGEMLIKPPPPDWDGTRAL